MEADRERTAALRAESVRAALGLAHGDASEIVAAANVVVGITADPSAPLKQQLFVLEATLGIKNASSGAPQPLPHPQPPQPAVPALSFAAEQRQAERRDLLAANQIIAAQREKEEAQRIRREALQKERAAAQRVRQHQKELARSEREPTAQFI